VPCFATAHDCLAKHMHTISREKCRGFHFVDAGVSCTMAGCLAAHRIDAAIGTDLNRETRPCASLVQFISIAALFHGCWHPRNRHERLRYLIEQLARILFFAQ
jgi:hypothetical protein